MLLRMIAQMVNDIGLPIRGAVFGIGGIETGLLIGKRRIGLTQPVEGGGGCVEGNGLGEELHLVARILLQQRRHIVRRVIAYGFGAGYHELGLIHDLAKGVVDEKGVGKPGDDQTTCPKDSEQDEVELGQQFHLRVSSYSTESTTRMLECG